MLPLITTAFFVLVLCWVGGRDSRVSLLGRRYAFPPHRETTMLLVVGDLLYGLRSFLYGMCTLGALVTALWTGYRHVMTFSPFQPWRWMQGPVPFWAPGIPWQPHEYTQYVTVFVVCAGLAAWLKRPPVPDR